MRTIFIISLLIFSLRPGFCQVKEQLKKEIDKILYNDVLIDYEKVPGIIVGVVHGDSTWVFSYGTIDKNTTISPEENTIFEIGDLTKVFTSSLISILENDGKISLDSSINVYLTENQKNKNGNVPTVKQLMSHSSGLPRLPFEFGLKEKENNNPFAHYTDEDLFKFFRNYTFDKKQQSKYIYSHVNYAILENIIENIEGRPYETVLIEKLFNPLQLENTFITFKKENIPYLARGYDKAKKLTKPWSFQSFKGAVGLKSNINDLLVFLKTHIGIINEDYSEIFESLQHPVIKTGFRKGTFAATGWHVISKRKKNNVCALTGATGGYRSYMAFVKEKKTGVIVLSNSPFGLKGFGFLILEMVAER